MLVEHLAQFVFALMQTHCGNFQLLIKDFDAVAALLLGTIHGEIGVTDEQLGRGVFRAALLVRVRLQKQKTPTTHSETPATHRPEPPCR